MARRFKPGETLKIGSEYELRKEDVVNQYGKTKRKYILSQDGKEYVLDSVTETIKEAFGAGENLIKWAVREVLKDFLMQFSPLSKDKASHLQCVEDCIALVKEFQSEQGSKQRWTFTNLCNRLQFIDGHKDFEVKPYFGWAMLGEMADKAEDARWRRFEQAGEIGTRAHKLLETWVANGGTFDHEIDGQQVTYVLENEHPEVAQAVRAGIKFWSEWGLEVVGMEYELFDLELGVGGTLDLIVRNRDGALWVIDWKTSGGVYESHIVQVHAYARMWEKMHRLEDGTIDDAQKVRAAYIIQIDKETANFTVVPAFRDRLEFIEGCKQWGRCVATVRWKEQNEKYLKAMKKLTHYPDGSDNAKTKKLKGFKAK